MSSFQFFLDFWNFFNFAKPPKSVHRTVSHIANSCWCGVDRPLCTPCVVQRMVVTTMTGDGEEKRLKESLLLLGTIGLLCKQLPPGGAEFAQVLHWTQRLCMEQTPGGVICCGNSGAGVIVGICGTDCRNRTKVFHFVSQSLKVLKINLLVIDHNK